MADGGFETAGSGRGVDICGREDSLLLLVNDFRRDFMVRERECTPVSPTKSHPVISHVFIPIVSFIFYSL
jgi:hypothetical protein